MRKDTQTKRKYRGIKIAKYRNKSATKKRSSLKKLN